MNIMRKLNIKELVDLRRKSDRAKQNCALNLKLNSVESEAEGGGDYWVSSVSAIVQSFKHNDLQPVLDRRSELEEKFDATKVAKTKTMYKRNINILYSFEDIDSNKWRPNSKIDFLKQSKDNQLLTVRGLQLQVTPNCVFEFEKDGKKEVGAIWFIAKLNGFSKDELGMFANILWLYLNAHFSKDRIINPQYCIAVDVYKGQDVSYLQPKENGVPMILNSTIDEIKKLMGGTN